MSSCPYCIRAKELLTLRGIPFIEHVISYSDDEAWKNLEKKTGFDTVPQIFVDGKFIGVCEDLEALDQKNKLSNLKDLSQAE